MSQRWRLEYRHSGCAELLYVAAAEDRLERDSAPPSDHDRRTLMTTIASISVAAVPAALLAVVVLLWCGQLLDTYCRRRIICYATHEHRPVDTTEAVVTAEVDALLQPYAGDISNVCRPADT